MTWRAAIPALLLTLLVGGCAGGVPRQRPSHEGTASTAPTGPARSTGRVVAVGPDLAVTVPAGWRVLRRPDRWWDVEQTALCLVPPGRHLRSCAGVSFSWGPDLTGPRGSGSYEAGRAGGWYDGTENALCPVGRSLDTRIARAVHAPTESGRRAVGGGDHSAAWDRWHATCTDGSTFDPQAWYLPQVEVLAKDLTGHPETAGIMASASFRTDGAEIPAPATQETAWVTAVDGDTFTIRPFRTYYNDAEGEAYAAQHGLRFPFERDHLDAPTGARREVDVSQAVCTGRVVVPGEIMAPVIGCGRFEGVLAADDDARVTSLLWWDADGTLAQVSQDYPG